MFAVFVIIKFAVGITTVVTVSVLFPVFSSNRSDATVAVFTKLPVMAITRHEMEIDPV